MISAIPQQHAPVILEGADARLYNADLAPTSPAQRTWSTYNFIALWFSMSMEVTTYMLAASLIAAGMNWKQAIGTILLGNLIVLVPMLLNAHAGAKYGIPFPVFVRAPFGPIGANVPAMLRALVACGWFGIQSWIGGQAIAQMLHVLLPATEAMPWVLWASFFGFWLLNMAVVWRGVDSIRFLQSYSAPFVLLMSLMLLFFMLHKAGGFGPMLSAPSHLPPTATSCESFSRRLPGWSATGPRFRSTFLTSRVMQKIKTRKSLARHSAFPLP